ncbi:MAG: hypothetical protein AB8H03_17070 [Saprospiraceae bacterium]
MKKHQQTDRIIKEKVDEYSMEVPMHLFAGIAEALDADLNSTPAPQKNSWRNRVWFLALLGLVIGGSGIWFLTSDSNSLNKTEAEMSITLNSNDEKTNFGKKEKIEHTSISNVNEETSNSKIEENNSIETRNEFVNEKIETSISNLNISTVSSVDKNKVGKTGIGIKMNSNSTKNSTIENASFETTTPKNILTQKGGTSKSKSKTNTSSNSSIINLPNEQTSASETNATLGEKPIAAIENKKITTTKVTKEVYNLPNLTQLANSSVSHSAPYRLAIEPTCGLKPDGSRVKFTTSVDAFFSPDYANQMLEYKSEDFKEHAQLRTDTEKPYYSFNTGVRVNFLTEFGWALRTGLVYTQINELLETQYTEIVTTLDADGNVIGITEGTREVNIRNKYKMIDVPVVFGYEVPMKKFDLNVNGGVYMNLISKQSGAFFSPIEDRVVYFTEGHPDDYDIFKNNIGLSIFMGLGFNFDLTSSFNADKKIQLIVEPHARFYPKSFALDNYILNQKYLSTGVMIGLRRDL